MRNKALLLLVLLGFAAFVVCNSLEIVGEETSVEKPQAQVQKEARELITLNIDDDDQHGPVVNTFDYGAGLGGPLAAMSGPSKTAMKGTHPIANQVIDKAESASKTKVDTPKPVPIPIPILIPVSVPDSNKSPPPTLPELANQGEMPLGPANNGGIPPGLANQGGMPQGLANNGGPLGQPPPKLGEPRPGFVRIFFGSKKKISAESSLRHTTVYLPKPFHKKKKPSKT